jgi:hypothetical protein
MLTKNLGLAGKDDFEAAQIDAVADFHKDVYNELVPYISTKLGYKQGDLVRILTIFSSSGLTPPPPLFIIFSCIYGFFGSGNSILKLVSEEQN